MAERLMDRAEKGAALALPLVHGEPVGDTIEVFVLPAVVARHALYEGTVDHGALTRVMPELLSGIHVFLCDRQTWMAGTIGERGDAVLRTASPAMAENHTASADLAWPTMASNAAGSRIARSDSTLRSTAMPALARPAMKRL